MQNKDCKSNKNIKMHLELHIHDFYIMTHITILKLIKLNTSSEFDIIICALPLTLLKGYHENMYISIFFISS